MLVTSVVQVGARHGPGVHLRVSGRRSTREVYRSTMVSEEYGREEAWASGTLSWPRYAGTGRREEGGGSMGLVGPL